MPVTWPGSGGIEPVSGVENSPALIMIQPAAIGSRQRGLTIRLGVLGLLL
jgi:hypothetical protein